MRSQKNSMFALGSVNKPLLLAALGAVAATVLVCEVPFLAEAFGFGSVSLVQYAVAIGLGACIVPIVEIVKLIRRRLQK
jgi:Ca2+-transporting ATPase